MGPDRRETEWLATIVLASVTVLLFGPAVLWLLERSLDHEQLVHAFIILGFAGAYLVLEHKDKLRLVGEFDAVALRCLMGSFGVLAAGWLAGFTWTVIPAFCLAAGGWLLFLFGPGLRGVLGPLLGAFGVYLLLVLGLERADWPLRMVSGHYAVWLLGVLGQTADLVLAVGREAKLGLRTGAGSFEVAAECNGFGLLASSWLLCLLLVIYRKVPWVDRVLLMVLAGFIALTANFLRIVAIVLLAPSFPGSYRAMHEVVGNVFFWAALAGVWWLARDAGRQAQRKAAGNLPEPAGVVFIDGECALCGGWARRLARWDRRGRLRFAAWQGETAQELRGRHPELPEQVGSIGFVTGWRTAGERVWFKSEAVTGMLRVAGGWGGLAVLGLAVPRAWRDAVYDAVARRRHRLGGSKGACAVPEGMGRERFLP